MTEENKFQIAISDGFLEACDFCNCLIKNRHWMGWSWVTFDNRIACNRCRGELLKKEIAETVVCS